MKSSAPDGLIGRQTASALPRAADDSTRPGYAVTLSTDDPRSLKALHS